MFDSRTHASSEAQKIAGLLRQIREAKGLTPDQVCRQLNLSPLEIEAIEGGAIDDYLEQIYGLLCIYTESVHSVFKGLAAKALYGIEGGNDLFNHVADCIVFHKKLHGKPLHLSVVPKARGKSQGRSTEFSESDEAKRKSKPLSPSVLEFRAQEIIDRYQLYRLPINVYQVAENLNINVVFESFPSDFYLKLKAFCYREEDFGLIGINKSHPAVLQRYSLAHELHHFLYDFNDNKFTCGPENENKAIEINSERFAAELLMPKQMVKRLISNPLNIHYLTIDLVAKHFGVSYEAAAIRLARFGLVNSAKEVCNRKYRKEDKQKTQFLLKEKSKYLKAVFGLETGITSLQEYHKAINYHSLCGAPITDPSHSICWQCGLELNPPSSKEFYLKNPYRQNPSNLLPEKIPSFQRFKDDDPNQLSLNLNVL